MIRIANGMPCVESARIRPGIEFSRPEIVVSAVEGIGDDDPRDHLADQDPEQHDPGTPHAELRERVRRGRRDQQAEQHAPQRHDQAGEQVAALLAHRGRVPVEAQLTGTTACATAEPLGCSDTLSIQ